MKYAIMGCIHANLSALRAVLRDAEEQGCSDYACCGDIVGFGVHPKQCLDLVREFEMTCVKGNHDDYCSRRVPLAGFNPQVAWIVEWSRAELTDEDKAWLQSLKL